MERGRNTVLNGKSLECCFTFSAKQKPGEAIRAPSLFHFGILKEDNEWCITSSICPLSSAESSISKNNGMCFSILSSCHWRTAGSYKFKTCSSFKPFLFLFSIKQCFTLTWWNIFLAHLCLVIVFEYL